MQKGLYTWPDNEVNGAIRDVVVEKRCSEDCSCWYLQRSRVATRLDPYVYKIAATIPWSLQYTERLLKKKKCDAEEQMCSAQDNKPTDIVPIALDLGGGSEHSESEGC